MAFEHGYKGPADDQLLERLVGGWVPANPDILPGGKTVYMRVLFFVHGWPRLKLMQVFCSSPGQVANALRFSWKGLETVDGKPATPGQDAPTVGDLMQQVEDWRRAYDSACHREEAWREKATHSKKVLADVTRYADRLAHSHPARLEKVQAIGKDLMGLIHGKKD